MIHTSLHTPVSLLQEHTLSHIHWVTNTNDTLLSAHTCVTTARTHTESLTHWRHSPPHTPLCQYCLLLLWVVTTRTWECIYKKWVCLLLVLCGGVPWRCLDISLVLCVGSWLLFSCLLLYLLFSLNFASFYQFLSMESYLTCKLLLTRWYEHSVI